MDAEKMARYWNQDADNYEKIISAELKSFRAPAWQELLENYLPPKTENVLDIGCGPGFFVVILAKMGYRVTAIDCSEKMLAKAKNIAARAEVSADFIHMNIADINFAPASFDSIVSRNVTWTLADPWKFYIDCHRLLKPGGRLLVFDANWHLPLFDEVTSQRVEKRRQKCLVLYGDDFESGDISEPFDVKELPFSDVKRPFWDVEHLRMVGFQNVHAIMDLTNHLWDDKEKLLYGETPLFGIFADK